MMLVVCLFLALLLTQDLVNGVDANSTSEDGRTVVSASDYGFHRSTNLPPLGGTINWERLAKGPAMFSPRHSHATCIFRCPHNHEKQCIWLAGGRSQEHYAYNLVKTNQNDDVWWSEDGALWNKVIILDGDFLLGIGNSNAKPKGHAAPWYGRYGHSLDAIDKDGDGIADIMVLTGGYSPVQSNDVWLSLDGINWFFDGYAPFPPRAYHTTAFFQKKLWILGGTPLTNDVWAGKLKNDAAKKAGYTVVWEKKLDHMQTPWFPRMGLCAVTQFQPAIQHRDEQMQGNGVDHEGQKEYLYILGGFGGYPRNDNRFDGERARNDVWVTSNGIDWKRVMPPKGLTTMPWVGRAFHSCITWNRFDAMKEVLAHDLHNEKPLSRIYMMGGGYFGTKGNNVVSSLEAYLDTWWTVDGSSWNRIDYMEGSGSALYSSSEWTLSGTLFEGRELYRGKWGHTVEAFFTREDLNNDGSIAADDAHIEFVNNRKSAVKFRNQTVSGDENKVPALFLIAGKPEGSQLVNDVFVTRPGCKNRALTGVIK
jgi:hypothetical protein